MQQMTSLMSGSGGYRLSSRARDTNGHISAPTGEYFSDSSRSVYDEAGNPVYYYRAETTKG